jgi:antitoxin component YwqK of YwqJK toxin-antitoxin module
MAGPGGSYERWCVEHDAGGQLVDHGPYRKWYAGGGLWVKGELDLGRRKGTWTTYDAMGGVVATVDY